MDEKAFGIDISSYQYGENKLVDFDRMKAEGKVKFVGCRASISWGYTDKWFARNWSELRRIDMPRLAYHVVYFDEDTKKQTDHFLRLAELREGEKLVLDLELEDGLSRSTITKTTLGIIEEIRKETGMLPVLYSRALWMNEFLIQEEFPKDIELWLAQYLNPKAYPEFTEEHPVPPMMPAVLKNWKFHQTAEKGSGEAVGVGSYYCDYDRFNGDESVLLAWFGKPVVENTLENRILAIEKRLGLLEKKLVAG